MLILKIQLILIYFNKQIFTNEQFLSKVINLLHISQKNVFFFLKFRRARPDRKRSSRLNSSDLQ
jgi:hypothetical protein